MQPLRRDVERDAAVLSGDRETGFGTERGLVLHRHFVFALDDDIGGRVRIAVHDADILDDVAILRVVELRRVGLQRRDRVGDRRQRLVLDVDRLRRQTRLLGIVGRDECHGLADVPHHAGREHRLVGAHEAELLPGRQIVGRDHRTDSRHAARGRDVDSHDSRVRVRAAERCAVQHALAREIARVQELSLDLGRRVGARSGFADDPPQPRLRRRDRHDV